MKILREVTERRSSRLSDEQLEQRPAPTRRYPPLVRLTEGERQILVDALLDGQLFTTHHIANEDAYLTPMIFTPIAAGVLAEAPSEYRDQVGTIYEYRSAAAPQTIHGYPVFLTIRVIHKDDWGEILKAFVDQHDERDRILMRSVGVSETPS